MQFFDAAAVRARLSWPRLLASLDLALRADVHAPLRVNHAIDVPGQPAASLLMMPAWRTGHHLGVKLVTVFPGNAARSQRSVAAVYVLFDAVSGVPIATLDGEELTARRTAAASAFAANRLARHDARRMVMIGAGRLSRGLIDAHRHVRPIDKVLIWSRTTAHASARAAECVLDGIDARATTDLEAAVADADVVACATLSKSPLVLGRWLKPGVHVDLVGAYQRTMRESDDDLMRRADLIVVDSREGALSEGGDLVQALSSGAIAADSVAADLRDLARGAHPGRTRDDQITVFKSVGFALEDLAAAEAVVGGSAADS